MGLPSSSATDVGGGRVQAGVPMRDLLEKGKLNQMGIIGYNHSVERVDDGVIFRGTE